MAATPGIEMMMRAGEITDCKSRHQIKTSGKVTIESVNAGLVVVKKKESENK